MVMVTLVDAVNQQEFRSSFGGPFHLSRPLCTRNLSVGPERFDCRHEATVLHLLLRIVAVPASIFELILGHPIDRLPHPLVVSISEDEQCSDHVASEAGLLPAYGLCPRVPLDVA